MYYFANISNVKLSQKYPFDKFAILQNDGRYNLPSNFENIKLHGCNFLGQIINRQILTSHKY